MLIRGGVGCGVSDDGAFGFSNDRSLVYCASTFSWGGGPASGGAPLPLVIKLSPDAKKPVFRRVANIALPASTRTSAPSPQKSAGGGVMAAKEECARRV